MSPVRVMQARNWRGMSWFVAALPSMPNEANRHHVASSALDCSSKHHRTLVSVVYRDCAGTRFSTLLTDAAQLPHRWLECSSEVRSY